MSIKPYTGTGLYLTGGRFENHAGNLFARPTTECLGGQCSKPTPAPAAKAAQPVADDLDAGRIYAARAEANEAARNNPARAVQTKEADPFTHDATAAIYGARH